MELDMNNAEGISWSDYCRTGSGLTYVGYMYWDGALSQSGDIDSPVGLSVNGSRTMAGQASVTHQDQQLFEFKGTGSDSMYLIEAPDYRRWTYSSSITATVSGTESTGEGQGFRSDTYIYASGGDVDLFEARGDVYWFDNHIQDHFDSVGMDLYMAGENGATPDDCTLEPKGWIGLRDKNAYWYDLVFMPQDASDSTGYLDDERSVCDGCGTLYLRGLETENYGQICPDFSTIFLGDAVALPDAGDFLLTLQQLEDETQ